MAFASDRAAHMSVSISELQKCGVPLFATMGDVCSADNVRCRCLNAHLRIRMAHAKCFF